MSLLKAVTKFAARSINDKCYDNKTNRNKRLSYNDTAKDIKNAKSKGYYVNGSNCYKNHLNKRNNAAKNLHNNIDKLISDF